MLKLDIPNSLNLLIIKRAITKDNISSVPRETSFLHNKLHVPALGVGSLGGLGSVGVVLLVLGLNNFT